MAKLPGKLALIANKKSAGRHKDLADVEELERMKESRPSASSLWLRG